MELKNKRVLITGASSGIGKSIAKLFIDHGSKVIVFGLNKPDYNVEFHKVDITKENEIIAALKKSEKIDILINNAGIAILSKIENASNEQFDKMFNTNIKGLFWVCKHSIPKINNNGCIINISSLAGLKSFEEFGIYCATKSAVISMTKTLALELADKKIRSNCIAPGIIDTIIWDKMYGKNGRKELLENGKYTLSKRVGKPEEIASSAIFLCQNEFINGETILIDGGEYLK